MDFGSPASIIAITRAKRGEAIIVCRGRRNRLDFIGLNRQAFTAVTTLLSRVGSARFCNVTASTVPETPTQILAITR